MLSLYQFLVLATSVLILSLDGSNSTQSINKEVVVQNPIMEKCRPWHILNVSTGNCECGEGFENIVRCSESGNQDMFIKACYCMTYSQELNHTYISRCHYTCFFGIGRFREFFLVTAKNTSDLNEDMCGYYHRRGLMCGQCEPGYAPAVYSYSSACVECKNYKYNWIKYIAIAYIPLTVFYVLMVLLKVSINSSTMVVYVTVSQIMSSRALIVYYTTTYGSKSSVFVEIMASIYAIWNRALYSPFCLHPDMSIFLVTSLDYIIGSLINTHYLLPCPDTRSLCRHISNMETDL